jgi:A/G-specific adenine glycosylase
MKKVHIQLLSWYKKYGRHNLLWRNTSDIYHIYISEIMLQQTQVNRVEEEYYPKFLQKFPTIRSLANASLDDVIALWSGLGYYSRARNIHKTSKMIDGDFPKEYKELLKLPGIGQYTASAICSFGYNQTIAVVDTNIQRVIKRFFALKDVTSQMVWDKAKEFVNDKKPRDHNLALMDLGSLVCLTKNPKCDICPLEKFCQGKNEAEIYTKKTKIQYEKLDLFYGLLIKNDKIALVKSQGSMYKNMLELPSIDPIEDQFIAEFRHSYTKYKLQVKLYDIEELVKIEDELIWTNLDSLDELPISSLTKKALAFKALV